MNNAGWKFREVRERLNLTYREVEDASRHLAGAKLNPEYLVTLSRLSDIENSNTLPTIYRIYTLCVVYRLSFTEALCWYGVDLSVLPDDSAACAPSRTQLIAAEADERQPIRLPSRLDPGFNPRDTNYLSRLIQTWGSTPAALVRQLDTRRYRYGYIGEDDWMMYPLVMPGALVQIDPERRKIETGTWRNEFERPIYFVELRNSYVCSWATPMDRGEVLLQPHPLSPCRATVVGLPRDAAVIGQVVGVAMHLAGATAGTTRATEARR